MGGRIWEWAVLGLAGLTLYLYGRGTFRLWLRNGAGRGVRIWQVGCFTAGIAALLAARGGPLTGLDFPMLCADTARHMLLLCLAAPLLVLSGPLAPASRGLPSPWRQRSLAWLGQTGDARRRGADLPLTVLLQAGVIGVCFTPAVRQWGLESEIAALTIDAALLGVGLVFWSVFLPQRYAQSHPNGAAAFWLFVSGGLVWMLAALLSHAKQVLYPAYDQGVSSEIWSALIDQQVSGLLIGVAGFSFMAGALAMLVRWRRAARQRRQSTEIMADSLPMAGHDLARQGGGGSASDLIAPRGPGAMLGGGSA